jgi:hypothetical protein
MLDTEYFIRAPLRLLANSRDTLYERLMTLVPPLSRRIGSAIEKVSSASGRIAAALT